MARPLEVPTALDRLVAEIAGGSGAARAEELTRELETSTSKERVGALAYELGELCERSLGDEARAVKAFGRALAADPSLRANLWAIRRVFYRRELWPNLVKLIGAETRFAATDAARADLLVERGHILEDRLGDADEAAHSYEQAVVADSSCQAALAGLERLALAKGDEVALERIWLLQAEASDTPVRKQSYYLDLCRMLASRGAPEELEQARALLARAAELGTSAQVVRMRAELAEKSGDPAELLAALDTRAAELASRFGPAGPPQLDAPSPEGGDSEAEGAGAAAEAGGDAAARVRRQIVAIRRRQGRIAVHHLNAPEAAWAYLQEATALLPGEPLLLADLADLAERLGKYEELAELVEGWESREVDPARSLSLALRRADALFRAGQEDAARSLLAGLSATQPGYVPILAVRERDALARGDGAALADTYVAAAEAARAGVGFGPGAPASPDPAQAAGYYLVAGDLYLHLVKRPEEARARYAQALEVLPGYPSAVEALAALHEQAGRLDDAAALYELHSESGDPALRTHVLERLVDLYHRMGRPAEVEGALRRIVALDPEDSSTHWRLEETLAALGRADERADVLVALAERTGDPDQRAAALLAAARMHDEQLGKPEDAIPLYRQVLEAWPADLYARQALAEALRRTGRWAELVAARRREAEEGGPGALRALREAAALLQGPLDCPGEAAEVLRELAEAAAAAGSGPGKSPRAVAAAADALRALADALVRAGDREAAIEVLDREATARGGGAAAEDALCRAAALAEEQGRPGEAEDAYRRALEIAPRSMRAQVALLDLAVRRRDAAAEADELGRLAEMLLAEGDGAGADGVDHDHDHDDDHGERDGGGSGGPADRRALAADLIERAAWLAAVSSPNGEGSLALFERGAELERHQRGALLGRVLAEARAGDPFALGDALSELAQALPGSYAAASLHLRAAVMAEVQSDERGVEERISRAFAAAPDDVGTLVVAAEYLPPASPAQATGDGAADEQTRRAELYAARAQLAADSASQNDWLLERAELLEAAGRLGDALKVVSEVLGKRPDELRALQLLRRICRRGGDRDGLARASAHLARLLGDHEGKLELLREAGFIFDQELGQAEHAVPVYRKILAEDPGAAEFDRLREILGQAGDTGGLFEALTQRLNHLDEADGPARERAELRVVRAELRRGVGDHRGASRDLAAALELDPRHADALFLRGQTLAQLGQAAEAARAYERFLEGAGEDPRRAQAELALSEILAENMDDLAGAIVQLEHVARQSPDDAAVRERLVDLLVRAGEADRAVDELRRLESLHTSPADRARAELRLARLLRDSLHDAAGAAAALERARQLDPLASEPVRQLVELFQEGDARRGKVLAQAATELRQAIAADPSRAALYERLAAVARWSGDGDGRALALEALGAIGSLSAEQKKFLAERAGSRRGFDPARLGGPLEARDWSALGVRAAGDFGAELWATIGPAVAATLPGDAGQLGFARGDRLKGRELDRRFPAVPAVIRALGCDEPEIYVADGKPGYVKGVSGDRRALYLGADVAAAETSAARFALGRAVALLHQGTSALAELGDDEVALWFAAAAHLAEVQPPAAVAARSDGRRVGGAARQLGRLGRRERKNLILAAGRFAELGDPGEWRRDQLGTAARAGLLLCGELGVALEMLDVGRGGRSLADDPLGLSLLVWAVSSGHVALRKRLGLA